MRGREMPQRRRTSSCRMRSVVSSSAGVMASLTARKRQVRGRKRHAQRFGGEQHDRMRGAGVRGEVFGVTGERHAGIVDHALLHGRRDHGSELAADTAVDGAIQQREHVPRVGRIEPASHAGRREWHVDDVDAAGCAPGLRAAR